MTLEAKLCADVIIHDTSGRVLMIERMWPPRAGSWAFPGGHMDEGELPHETAAREALEEVGITTGPLQIVGSFIDDIPNDRRLVNVFTNVDPIVDPVVKLQADECGNYRWFDVAPDDMVDWQKQAWDEWCEMRWMGWI